MQRRKKQLLGLAGLVLVGVVTVIACTLPSPGASAVDNADETGGVGIQVTVGGNPPVQSNPLVKVATINNETTDREVGDVIVTTDRVITVRVAYRNSDTVLVRLKNDSGEIASAKCSGVSFSSTEQYCTVQMEVDGKYLNQNVTEGDRLSVNVVGERLSTGTVDEDTYSFIYRSAYIYTKNESDQTTKDPVIYAVANSDVKYAMILLYGPDGKQVTLKEPLELSAENFKNGAYKITLPFKENGLAPGKYKVVMMAYNTDKPSEDGLVSVSTLELVYDPEGVLPPDTGSRVLGDLNISRADYILTGLVAFGLVTMFAVFLIVRRNKR